jgi:hypothetical protein
MAAPTAAPTAAPEISLESLESLTSALRARSSLPWHAGSALQRVFDSWVEDIDRGARLHEPADAPLANDMHVVGACVCVLLGRSPQLQGACSLRGSLGAQHDAIILTETPLHEYTLDDVQNAVAALQLEFTRLYAYAPGEGYRALCDVEAACVLLLARLGQWLGVRWRAAGSGPAGPAARPAARPVGAVEMEMPGEALRGQAALDADGFCQVRLDAAVFVLDAVHSMLGLHRLLTRARARDDAAAAAGVLLAGHHLEASGEVFFMHSMTADCVVGTIAQYAHKFAYLFHSISQAIYYNRPNYQRKLQLPLARLQEPTERDARGAECGPSAVNLLALLLELRPDVPVLFEHTGAGHRGTHAQHAWAWVLWAGFVLLVDARMEVAAALDARALAALLGEG